MQIARLIGGAGTGKTTELLRIMEAALKQIRDPSLLGFASFTRAARSEAVTRASSSWGIDPEILSKKGWFRTVHSTALRCLGDAASAIIGDGKKDLEWLSKALGVSLSTEVDDSFGRTQFIGDPDVAGALNCWSIARTTLTNLEEVVRRLRSIDDDVPDFARVIQVVEKYESAKRLDDRMDFNDSLMRFSGVRMKPRGSVEFVPPLGFLPEVSAWLFDEQQDASPLLDLACKRLISSPTVQWCYVVGDPFQSIYGFAGSSSDCFMAWPANKERTMPKSWRCPKKILDFGESCLRQMTKGYFDRGIAPADRDGAIFSDLNIEDAVTAAKPDEDWLFIARTNYQAGRLAAALTSFGKPLRWVNQPEGVSNRAIGLAGLLALEEGKPITGLQWQCAIDLLPQRDKEGRTFLDRGVKARWKGDPEIAKTWDRIFPEEIEQVGATPELVDALKSARWATLVQRGSQWRTMAKKWGAELTSGTGIRVGTIHSVKGAEAENVAILTTTSRRVQRGMEDEAQRNEECRVAYVAVTRSKRNLYIINEGKSSLTPKMEILL